MRESDNKIKARFIPTVLSNKPYQISILKVLFSSEEIRRIITKLKLFTVPNHKGD